MVKNFKINNLMYKFNKMINRINKLQNNNKNNFKMIF